MEDKLDANTSLDRCGDNLSDESGLEKILSALADNNVLLKQINEIIGDRFTCDAVKDKAFDKLYEEMIRQKESVEILDRVIQPVLSDLLLLFDNINNFENLISNQAIAESDIPQYVKCIKEDLLEILYRQEVLPLEENCFERFDSKIHKAEKIEVADNKEDDYKIVSLIRSGFMWRKKVLRPHSVVIKRFTINNQ